MKHEPNDVMERLNIIGDMVSSIKRDLFFDRVLLLLIAGQVIYFSFKY